MVIVWSLAMASIVLSDRPRRRASTSSLLLLWVYFGVRIVTRFNDQVFCEYQVVRCNLTCNVYSFAFANLTRPTEFLVEIWAR